MAQELNIIEEKQVVCNGFVQYSQEIVELAKQGYVLDIRNRTCPQFQLGLFTCSMLLLKTEREVEEPETPVEPVVVVGNTDKVDEPLVHPIVDTLVVAPTKKPGRPSRKEAIKAELAEKLGDAATVQLK